MIEAYKIGTPRNCLWGRAVEKWEAEWEAGVRKGLHRFGGTNSDTGELRKSLSGGRVQEGRPWQETQPRGARTWADANLSRWAFEGTDGKDVLP